MIWIALLPLLLKSPLDVVDAYKYTASAETCKTCACFKNDGHSLILNCTDRNLKHLPADWPPHSTQLTATFSYNHIPDLPQLPESTADRVLLVFSHCNMRQIQSAAFLDIINITFLDLSWNELTGESIHSDVFRGRFNTREYEPLSKLATLDLSHNNIHVLGPRGLEHMPNLLTLYLNNNPLKVLALNTVSAISLTPYLQFLDLSSTRLEHISEDAFARFKHLIRLNLRNNSIVKVPESIVSSAETLRHLDFSENAATEFNDESFLGLRNLHSLNISGMPFLDIIHAGTFEQQEHLQMLHCANNPALSIIDKDAFGDLKGRWPIVELDISGNALQQISQKLVPWDRVVRLDMSGNPWRCDCQLFHTVKKIQAVFRTPSTQHPVCSEPPALSGISIFRTPYKLCEKQPLNGTLNGILKVLYRDDEKRNTRLSRRPNILWISFVCGGLVVALTIVGIVATALLRARQRKLKDSYAVPIKYTIANSME